MRKGVESRLNETKHCRLECLLDEFSLVIFRVPFQVEAFPGQ